MSNFTEVDDLIPGLASEPRGVSEIAKSTCWSLSSTYAESLLGRLRIYCQIGNMSEYAPIEGKVLIDLGAGGLSFGYEIARVCGASGYIAIEPFNNCFLLDHLNACLDGIKRKDEVPTPCALVPTDALNFLSRIPSSSSICLLACGLDQVIIRDLDYVRQCEEHITRVLGPGGIFVKRNSVFHPKGLRGISDPVNGFCHSTWIYSSTVES